MRVYVNGEQAACLWLNLLFQGVELPSGQNEIVFQFRPEHFPAFVSVSFVSLFVVLSLLSWPLVPWKRKGKGFRLVDKIRDFT